MTQSETVTQIRAAGFWFVDIPRTSSSSIKVELGNRFGPPFGKSNLLDRRFATPQSVQDHVPATRMRDFLGRETWNQLFTFSFVRNPWDRMVSMYFYRLKKGHYSEALTFRDYVLQLSRLGEGSKPDLFANQVFYLGCSDYLYDGSCRLVDCIGRFENRQADIGKIAARIGFHKLGELWIQDNSGKQEHYSKYYDEETRNIIEHMYSRDIGLFGYRFESPG